MALATVTTATSKFPTVLCGVPGRAPSDGHGVGEGIQCWSLGPFYLPFLRDGDKKDVGHTTNQGSLRTLSRAQVYFLLSPEKVRET